MSNAGPAQGSMLHVAGSIGRRSAAVLSRSRRSGPSHLRARRRNNVGAPDWV